MRSVKTYGDATNEETSSRINDLYPPLRESNSNLDSLPSPPKFERQPGNSSGQNLGSCMCAVIRNGNTRH
jgi:hypothetical protein